METINIFIGNEPKTNIPCKVLQYSILKHTKNPVEFTIGEGESWIDLSKRKLGVGTGFSLQRWSIPEGFNYEGFCIYLDADQIVLTDIAELWNINVTSGKPNASSIYCTYQSDKWYANAPNTSVMLIDNEMAKTDWWTIEQIVNALELDCPNRKTYAEIMHAKHILNHPPVKITDDWNCLNKPTETTKLLHYTVEHAQPWYNPKHPYAYVWKNYMIEAIKEGFIQKTEVKEAIGNFRPATRNQRANGIHPYWTKWIR